MGRGTVGDGARWPAVRAGAAVGFGVVALSGRCGPAAVRVVALEGGERAEARPSSAATETGLRICTYKAYISEALFQRLEVRSML